MMAPNEFMCGQRKSCVMACERASQLLGRLEVKGEEKESTHPEEERAEESVDRPDAVGDEAAEDLRDERRERQVESRRQTRPRGEKDAHVRRR